jgi:hypothetical protein
MLARLDKVRHEIGIAGVEADARARKIRPLRNAVHRQHALEALAQNRCARGGKLDVALVAREHDIVGTRPFSRAREVFVIRRLRRRVARFVHPQHDSPRRVRRIDCVEIEVPTRSNWHRHGPHTRERGAHLIGRICDSRIQHGVAARIAQAQGVRERCDEFFRADARADHRRIG